MSAAADIALPDDCIVHASLTLLAPKFRASVEAALAECPDAMVYETYRTNALQKVYYARGRTVKPPENPVTNAPDNLWSWHGFSLACDVIHKTLRWDAPLSWFHQTADVFKRHGCDWGGDWHHPDYPHFQFGGLKPSPSSRARVLHAWGGVEAVWREVGAI